MMRLGNTNNGSNVVRRREKLIYSQLVNSIDRLDVIFINRYGVIHVVTQSARSVAFLKPRALTLASHLATA